MNEYESQVAAETKSGLLPVVGRNVAWYMGERSAISARTLLHGPTKGSSFFKAAFGLVNTPEELQRWTAGQTAFPLPFTQGRRSIGSKIIGWTDKEIRDGRGILGSVYTPSSWMTAAKIGTNPGKYQSWAYNASMGVTSDVVPTQPTRPGVLGPYQMMPVTSTMTPELAAATINNMLRLGSNYTYKQSAFSDVLTGMWFNGAPKVGVGAAPPRYAQWQQSGNAVVSKLGRVGERGAAWRIAGVNADDVGAGLMSGFAKGASSLGMGIGVASRIFGNIQLGIMAGELAYTVGKQYFYELPKAAISSVGLQLTRPAFSSGDASLLTGIPANNRMRAVQAIQGSRLNARGALGSEASMMASHFG